jgi:hypothetical protein
MRDFIASGYYAARYVVRAQVILRGSFSSEMPLAKASHVTQHTFQKLPEFHV